MAAPSRAAIASRIWRSCRAPAARHPKPSPLRRGMTCRCVWGTSCPAAAPSARENVTASHSSNPRFNAAAIRCAQRASCATSAAVSSVNDSTWRRGTTSVWPGVAGWMSRNATTRSLSSTRLEGSSPARMRQNVQEFMPAQYSRRDARVPDLRAIGRLAGQAIFVHNVR
jgi:hypothetical protein